MTFTVDQNFTSNDPWPRVTLERYTMFAAYEHARSTCQKRKYSRRQRRYSPPDTSETPLIAPKVPYAAALYENIRRLRIDVQTIVPFHGLRTADLAELRQQTSKKP